MLLIGAVILLLTPVWIAVLIPVPSLIRNGERRSAAIRIAAIVAIELLALLIYSIEAQGLGFHKTLTRGSGIFFFGCAK